MFGDGAGASRTFERHLFRRETRNQRGRDARATQKSGHHHSRIARSWPSISSYSPSVSAWAASQRRDLRIVVHLHEHTVGTRRHAGPGQRRHHVILPRGMRSIDHHRQMRDAPDRRNRCEVECCAYEARTSSRPRSHKITW